jgi:hypothetical protein
MEILNQHLLGPNNKFHSNPSSYSIAFSLLLLRKYIPNLVMDETFVYVFNYVLSATKIVTTGSNC